MRPNGARVPHRPPPVARDAARVPRFGTADCGRSQGAIRRFGLLTANELEPGVADLDLVAGRERLRADPLAVHLGAVRALEVLDRVDPGLRVEQDQRVLARDV